MTALNGRLNSAKEKIRKLTEKEKKFSNWNKEEKWVKRTKQRVWDLWDNFKYQTFFFFLGPHLRHVEVPRLGVQLDLQLQATTTATAMPDLSCICNLCHSLRQHQILNTSSEARDWTCVLTDTILVRNLLIDNGNSKNIDLKCSYNKKKNGRRRKRKKKKTEGEKLW